VIKRWHRLLLLVALIGSATSTLAHHGAGVYDRTTTLTLTGTVTQFHFVNPHVLIYIEVEDEEGRITEWSGELTSPNRLARMLTDVRWHKDILKPGETITLTGNPARNGAPALLLSSVQGSNGDFLIRSGR
jgi:hypothetical protein